MKKSTIIILGILAVVVVLIVVSRLGEDSWICKDGVWQKHGNPSAPTPTAECN